MVKSGVCTALVEGEGGLGLAEGEFELVEGGLELVEGEFELDDGEGLPDAELFP